SFLTPRLVEQARRQGRQVVGVFDEKDGVDAKRYLLDCGVDDVVDQTASPEEFLAVVRGVVELAPYVPVSAPPVDEPATRGRMVVVGAPPGGCGATEVAVGLGEAGAAPVVDADDLAPSLAQRMGAPLHPNLRTAIDVVHHRSGRVDEALIRAGPLQMVPGLVTGDDWAQLHPGEVEAVIEDVAQQRPAVVVNVGSGLERPQQGEGRFGLARGVVRRADVVVAVGLAHPVSVTRLVRWVGEAALLAPDAAIHVVINRVDRSPFRRSEVESELAEELGDVPVHFLPEDKRVAEAAWAGAAVSGGPFRRAVRRLASEIGL
ncbi:MAG: hypothetical protein ACLFWM_04755, partial [Actinomycetota bacterium]